LVFAQKHQWAKLAQQQARIYQRITAE